MVAAAVIGGAVIGGVASSIAGGKAASAQENAANTAANTQLTMYNQTRADQAPYRQAGYAALGQMGAGTQPGGEFNRNFTLADFTKDPGYQFRMDQGLQGVQASAAARGGLLSGGTLKALDQYGQGFASNEYQNAYNRFNTNNSLRFNRLASISGVGQTSLGQTGSLGANAANQIGSAQMGYGNAAAAGYINQGNAMSNSASSLGNFYLQQQWMKAYAPQSSSGGTAYVGNGPTWGH